MRVEVSCKVRAPRQAVWAWWTDFGREGESFRLWHGNGWGQRTILKSAPERVEFTDKTPLAGDVRRVVTISEPYRFTDEGTGAQTFRSEWRFDEVRADTTRIVRSVEFENRLAQALGPVGRWLAAGLIRRDLVAHARQCERDLTAP